MDRVYRPDHCALCGRRKAHPIHDVPPPLPVWKRLLRLAWPSWMWGAVETNKGQKPHQWRSKAARVEAAEQMARFKRRFRREYKNR